MEPASPRKRSYRMKNTRRQPRLRTGYLLKYLMIDGGMPEAVRTANTKDLSTSGVRFLTNETMEAGTLLRVQILIPPLLEEVSAFGRVVRSEEASDAGIYDVSVAFLEIARKDSEVLGRLIESRLRTREAGSLFDESDVVTRSHEDTAE